MKFTLLLSVALLTSVGCASVPEAPLAGADAPVPPTPGRQWEGKKVLFLGDSISDPNVSRYFKCRYYWSYLAEWMKIDAEVSAVSGYEWKHVIGLVEKAKAKMKGDPDAVVMMMGTNDYNHNLPIGEWDYLEDTEVNIHGKMKVLPRRVLNRDTGTYRGRINVVSEYLKTTFPNAQIVYLTPVHRAFFTCGGDNIQPDETFPNEIGLYIDDYVKSIREAGAKWSIPVIDTFAESSLCPLLDCQGSLFVNKATGRSDRLHPNAEGHRRIALTVYYRLMTLPSGF